MPYYHFHSADGVNPDGDIDHREIESDEQALLEARTAACEALVEDVSRGASAAKVVVTVDREDGSKLASITMQAETEYFAAEPSSESVIHT